MPENPPIWYIAIEKPKHSQVWTPVFHPSEGIVVLAATPERALERALGYAPKRVYMRGLKRWAPNEVRVAAVHLLDAPHAVGGQVKPRKKTA
jgi:hypothetical protein